VPGNDSLRRRIERGSRFAWALVEGGEAPEGGQHDRLCSCSTGRVVARREQPVCKARKGEEVVDCSGDEPPDVLVSLGDFIGQLGPVLGQGDDVGELSAC
jgi:hypothetical protein